MKHSVPVLQHPDDKVGLLLHDVEVLRGGGVKVRHREAECIRLNLRVPAGLPLDGHDVGGDLGK